jgi:serine/threonine-protein kinase HipA
VIPQGAAVATDVYKAGVLAGHMWRVRDEVTFRYLASYRGPAVAFSLPLGTGETSPRLEAPPFFAGLLPEGATRRRTLARALHVAEDDELGLLARIGADTIGDVQIVPAGESLHGGAIGEQVELTALSFAELWELPQRVQDRSTVAGVQPKISYHSRSLIGGKVGRVILKFSPDEAWRGVLENEALFLAAAPKAGLTAARAEVVQDREGVRALAVARFDRTVSTEGRLVRHAQEDATQVLGLRPGQKYDPDARTVLTALSQVCTAPPVAARDLLHQLLYSYAIGNNDLHAKNLSVGQDPATGVWSATPVYDVLHTWPYEGDHRFHPAVGDAPHDTASRRSWLALGADLGIPSRVVERLCDRVADAVGGLVDHLDGRTLAMPDSWVRDVRRRVMKRVRDIG